MRHYLCLFHETVIVLLIALSFLIAVSPEIAQAQPEAITDLTIQARENHIWLSWTAPPDAEKFNVYRDTEPYFKPDSAGGTNRIADGVVDQDLETPGVQWEDSTNGFIGNPEINYFYVVTALDAAGAESENSNRVGEFDRALKSGWHLISLPVQPEDLTVASVLNSLGEAYTIVWQLDPEQGWLNYDPERPDFLQQFTHFELWRGYMIELTADAVWTVVGTVPDYVEIDLAKGWTLLGYPSPRIREVSQSLATIGKIDIIWTLDDASQWQNYDPDRPPFLQQFTDLEPGHGYQIRMLEDATWTVAPISLTITFPEDGTHVNTTNIAIAGTVDEYAETVTVNDNPVDLQNDEFVASDVELKPGENTISITVTDAAGNSVTDTIDVTLEPTEGLFTIEGIAVDETDVPIPASKFYAMSKYEFDGGLFPNPFEDTLSYGPDPVGRFVITMPEGTYDIRFSPSPTSGYLAVILKEVEATSGGMMDLGNVVFERGAQITGLLIDDARQLVPASRFYADSTYDFNGDVQIYPRSEQIVIGPPNVKGQFIATVPEGKWDLALIPCQESGLLTGIIPDITAQVGQMVTLGEITLNTGFRVTGTVVDSQGQPLNEYRVASLLSIPEAVIVGPNDKGEFAATLPAGAHELKITPSAQSELLASVLSVEGNAGDTKNLGTIPLMTGYLFSWRLVDEEGEPVTSDRFYTPSDFGFYGDIQVYPLNHSVVIGPPDENGIFSVTLPEGVFTIVLIPGPESGLLPTTIPDVVAPPGVAAQGMNDIVLTEGFRMTGTVADSQGQSLNAYKVVSLIRNPEVVIFGPNEQGEFAATLPAGTHNLKIIPSAQSGLLASVLSVEGDIADIQDLGTIPLAAGRLFSWRLVDETNEPVTSERFYAPSDSGFYGDIQVYPLNHSVVTGPPDEDGIFSVTLPDGEFNIVPIPSIESGLLASTILNVVASSGTSPVIGSKIVLAQGLQVVGTVKDNENQPLPHSKLYSLPALSNAIIGNANENGIFRATLPPGAHDLKIVPSSESGLLAKTIRVEGQAGEILELPDVRLQEGFRLSVRLLDQRGVPVSGNRFYHPSVSGFYGDIQVYPLNHSVVIGALDEEGTFSVTLPEGKFNIVSIPSLESGLLAGTIPNVVASSAASLAAGVNEIVLAQGFQIIGTVKDNVNQPLPYTKLYSIPMLSNAIVGNANEKGTFFATLPPGTHDLKLVPSVESGLLAKPITVNGQAGEVIKLSNVRLEKGFHLSVRLLDQKGASVSSKRFYQPSSYGFYGEIKATPETPEAVYGAPNEDGFCVITLPEGKFNILFVPAVESHLLAKNIKGVVAFAGKKTDLGDLKMRSGFTVIGSIAPPPKGKVSTGSLALSGIAGETRDGIWVHPNFERAEDKKVITVNLGGKAAPLSTDEVIIVPPTEQGRFAATVDPGSWDFSIVPAAPKRLLPKKLSIAGGQMGTLDLGDIPFEPGVAISATLYSAENPLAEKQILTNDVFFKPSLFDFDGELHMEPSDTSAVLYGPNAQGQLLIVAPEGTYGVTFTPSPASGLLSQTISGIKLEKGKDVDLGDVTLYEGQVITGKVVDDEDKPLTNFHVVPSPAGGPTYGNDVIVAGNEEGMFSLTLGSLIFGQPRTDDLTIQIIPPAEKNLLAHVITDIPPPQSPIDLGVTALEKAHTVSGRLVSAATGEHISGEVFYTYTTIQYRSDFAEDRVKGIFAHLKLPEPSEDIDQQVTVTGPNSDGRFLINLPYVPDGIFSIQIVPSPASGFIPLPREGEGSLVIESKSAGVEEEIGDIVLQPGFLVSGTVQDTGGNPYAEYEVVVTPLDDPEHPITYRGGLWGDNTFQITLAGPADITVKSVTGAFAPQVFKNVTAETNLGDIQLLVPDSDDLVTQVHSRAGQFDVNGRYEVGAMVEINIFSRIESALIASGTIQITSVSQGYDSGVQNLTIGELAGGQAYYHWDTTGLSLADDYVVNVTLTDIYGNVDGDGAPGDPDHVIQLIPNYPRDLPKVVQVEDFNIPGRGLSTRFVRTYDFSADYLRGPIGVGWTHNYSMVIQELPDGIVKLLESDGSVSHFKSNGDGTYDAPPGDTRTLTGFGDGVYELRTKFGTIYRFEHFEFESDRFVTFPQSLLTSITDRNNNQITLHRFSDGKLLSVMDPAGRTTLNFEYEGSYVSRITDLAGREVTFEYDFVPTVDLGDVGRLKSVTNPAGYQTTYDYYESTFQLTSITDPRGNQRLFTVDWENRLTSSKVKDAGGTVLLQTSYSYSNTEPQYIVTDGRGNKTTYTVNAYGLVTEIQDALENITTFTYDDDLNLIRTVDPRGNETNFRYDELGNLLSATDDLGNAANFMHEEVFSNLTSVKDPRENLTSFEYDPNGNLTSITDPLEQLTTFENDNFGNVTAVVDALGNRTEFDYYDNGLLKLIRNPRGNETIFTYDALGDLTNITQMNMGEPRETILTYDSLNRLIQRTDAEGNITRFEYDEADNLTQIINVIDRRDNIAATFEYDGANRLIRTTFPDGTTETIEYDAVGNIIQTTNRNEQIITFEYDKLNRLTRKSFPDGTEDTLKYDEVGNLIEATDEHGTILFESDDLNRVKKVTYPSGETIQYDYDEAGNRIQLIDTDGNIQNFVYDELNRLIEIRDGAGQLLASYQYDEIGRIIERVLENGVRSGYGYNENNWLTELVNKRPDDSIISSFAYTYDDVGNRLSMTSQNGTIQYTYDKIDQLIGVDNPEGMDDFSYTFDPLGNRLSVISGDITATYTTNQLNQYTNLIDDLGNSTQFSYDVNGNLIQMVSAQGTTFYLYDAENQLVRVDTPTETITFEYDPFGRRISKTDASRTTKFIYDENRVITEKGADGSTLATYLYGIEIDEVLRMSRNGANFYYSQDGLGSVRDITDFAGATVETYDYDAYGISSTTSSIGNPYLFTGRRYDANIMIYYYRARYYNSFIGRFVSVDPIGVVGGINLYSYVHNNPVNFIDPTGTIDFQIRRKIFEGELFERKVTVETRKVGITKGKLHGEGEIYINDKPSGTIKGEFRRDPVELKVEVDVTTKDKLRIGFIEIERVNIELEVKIRADEEGNKGIFPRGFMKGGGGGGGGCGGGAGDPTFIQPARGFEWEHAITPEQKNVPTSKDSDAVYLVAKISVPYEGSLVRANVPIFGLAYGKDFKEYRVEYGKGRAPEEWIPIVVSADEQRIDVTPADIDFSADRTITGNLATWDTGLKEYTYWTHPPDHPIDLNGIYTVRLVVTDTHGNTAEDRVTVEVGRVIPNMSGGLAVSSDGLLQLKVQEQSLSDSFRVIGIKPVDDAPSIPEGYKLVWSAYEVRPPGEHFTKPAKLEMKYAQYDLLDEEQARLGLYAFDYETNCWQLLSKEHEESKTLTSCITDTPSKRAFYAALVKTRDAIELPLHASVSETVSSDSSENIPSFVPKIQNEYALCQNTFEDGIGQWANRDGRVGASLALDTASSQDGMCLRLTNTNFGGNFAATAFNKSFDLKEYPVVEFDYKIPADVKVNMLVKVNGRWYDVVFTDEPQKEYININLFPLGEIPNVQRDNQWHHARINLYEMFKRWPDKRIVDEFIFADWDDKGFMKLEYGTNRQGAAYCIDNFIISRQAVHGPQRFYLEAEAPRSIRGYSYTFDRKPDTVFDETIDTTEAEILVDNLADGIWYLHVRAQDNAGNWSAMNHYKFNVQNDVQIQTVPWEIGYDDGRINEFDASSADEYQVGANSRAFPAILSSSHQRTRIKFTLTQEDLDSWYRLRLDTAPSEGASTFSVQLNGVPIGQFQTRAEPSSYHLLLHHGLKVGPNELALVWMQGKSPIAWDYICLESANQALWDIGDLDGSNREFTHEVSLDDDYYVGSPDETFEWGISEDDPHTNIHFYLEQTQAQQLYKLELHAIAWQQLMADYVLFDVLLNGHRIRSLRATYSQDNSFNVLLHEYLREGWNTLTLQWTGGGRWLSWDYVCLKALDTLIYSVADGWRLGVEDNSRAEFSSAEHVGDAFIIGDDAQWFEGGIADGDPTTNILFFIEKIIKEQPVKLKLVAHEIREEKSDFVKSNVYLNGELKAVSTFRRNQKIAYIGMQDGLKQGLNTLTIEWAGGARWVTWDALALEIQPQASTPSTHVQAEVALHQLETVYNNAGEAPSGAPLQLIQLKTPRSSDVEGNMLELTWEKNHPKVVGYSFAMDTSPKTIPPRRILSADTRKTYSNLSPGTWYFHLRAKLSNGEWSEPIHYRFVVAR